MLSLIAAVSENGVIGRDGDLPWDLPDDLKHFRETTRGCPVIMGRETAESVVHRLGKLLPGRQNIVLTRQESYSLLDADIAHSLSEALAKADGESVFVIGGKIVYEEALKTADTLYLTHVHVEIEGDTFFPEVDWSVWREVSRQVHDADASHEYAFDIVEYERIRS